MDAELVVVYPRGKMKPVELRQPLTSLQVALLARLVSDALPSVPEQLRDEAEALLGILSTTGRASN